MARSSGQPRRVQCYLCGHRFGVGRKTQSTSCPSCHKPVIVEDLVLKKNKPKLLLVSKVQTCGRIVVPKGSRIGAELVVGHEGVEVQGQMEARRVVGRHVVIGAKAEWRGDVEALTLRIHDGAKIRTSRFDVPNDDLSLSTLSDDQPPGEAEQPQ